MTSPARTSQALQAFFKQGRADGGSFESGIDLGAAAHAGQSEVHLPRRARSGRCALPAASTVCRNLAIASRLSFFLWSTPPDEELLDLAEKGRLDAATLERQVRRMLADPRSQALIDNFLAQWLQLRNLKGKQPNSHEFPDFDDNLRVALQTEIELFFASIIREDRSVMDLLTADYTFVNERLARHYGIPYVYGTHFRRVTLQDDVRRGLLGKGALLMVTSHPASHVARPARQMDPRERARRAASAAAGCRAAVRGEHRGAQAALGARADGAAPAEPGVRRLSPHDRPGRPGARELRCDRCVADARRRHARHADRRLGAARGRHADQRRDRAEGGAGPRPRIFVQTLTERLLTYALGRGLDGGGHARRAHDCP